MKRSVTHQAVNMNAKLLLFMGGGYNGSAYHYSHEQFVGKLREHKKEVEYFIIPLAGHNFVLYVDSPEAKVAYKIQSNFLQKHYPGKP